MTSKLKCPVCQNNLHQIDVFVSVCINDKCKLWGATIPNLVLEALIQSQHDLQIAKQALEEIKNDLWCNRNITARQALEQITHDNKE